MKRLLTIALAAVFACFSLSAQNDKADNIIGKYTAGSGSDAYKVNFFKAADGSYTAQIYWLANPYDKDGKISYDTKNPDKSLRSTPADRIVIFSGLKYDARKHEWNGTKIYDPQRGVRAKLVAEFADDGRLALTGSVLVISETVYWKKIK